MRHVHGGRALLNQEGHHSTAAIVAEIDDTRKTKGSYPDASIVLSDCSRSITLEFSINDVTEHQNNLHKVDVMLDLLKKFRRGLVIEHKRAVERKGA